MQGSSRTPDEALRQLLAGNRRYRRGTPVGPHRGALRRRELATGQGPWAAVLGCSDSRVPPEILFDVGLGDLFVVRIAGNVAGEDALGSLEYAAGHLGVPLVLVLGHAGCGAVKAALEGAPAEGHLGCVLGRMGPAAEAARARSGDAASLCARLNVLGTAALLRSSEPVLAPLVREGKLSVVGGLYDLETGEVTVLPER